MAIKSAKFATFFLCSFLFLSPASFALQESGEIEKDEVVPDQHWRAGVQLIPGGVTHGSESIVIDKMDKLVGAALDSDPNTAVYDKAVTHYRKKSQRAKAATCDAVNAIVPYSGFAHSSEGGDLILNEQLKLHSRAAAEYARQKNVDEKHFKITSAVMHIATGLGSSDPSQAAEITASGIQRLQALVGESSASEMFETIKKWRQDLTIPDTIFAQKLWTPDKQEENLHLVVNKAMDNDRVVHSIEKQVYKFNHMSKTKRVAGKVVRTTLGAACLTPTLVGPAAQVGLTAFEVATGGPEESKLLKELYLMKRLQSRSKVLSEQAHMALSNYQLAILTKNATLLALSELMINDLAGSELAAKIITVPILDSTKSTALKINEPVTVTAKETVKTEEAVQ